MRRAVEVFVVLLTISLSFAVMAYAHGGDTTRIHSCVNNSSGQIKIVGASVPCKTNEHSLDWNQEGSAGSIISTRVVVNSVTVPGDPAPVSVSAFCNGDEWLTGGGFDQTSAPELTPLDVLRSSPAIVGTGLANGWTARARNRTNGEQVLIVFALCGSSAP